MLRQWAISSWGKPTSRTVKLLIRGIWLANETHVEMVTGDDGGAALEDRVCIIG